MILGARQLGTRALGDSTSQVAITITVVTAAVSFTADTTLDVAADAHVAVLASVAFTVDTTLAPTGALKRDAGPLSFTVDSDLRLRTLIRGRDYRLVLVDVAGERYAELPNATMGDLSWELNGPGGFAFALGQDDPSAGKVIPIEREVEVWKGDTLLWGGPIVRPQANAQAAEFQAATPEWYLTRRNVGKADRTNYVPDGDFENGYGVGFDGTGWGVQWSSPLEPATGRIHTRWVDGISSIRAVTGKRSLRLEQVASGQPKYGVSASQYFEWTVDPDLVDEEGDIWTLTAYAYVPSSEWRGPRLDRAGLELGRFSTTEFVVIGAEDGSS